MQRWLLKRTKFWKNTVSIDLTKLFCQLKVLSKSYTINNASMPSIFVTYVCSSHSFVLKSILHTPSIVTCLRMRSLINIKSLVIKSKSSCVPSSQMPWIIKPSIDDFNATTFSFYNYDTPFSLICSRSMLVNILE